VDWSRGRFDLDDKEVNVGGSDVFDRVRRIWFGPECGAKRWTRDGSRVEQDVSLLIAANEIAPGTAVLDARPSMRVNGGFLTWGNQSFKYAHVFVFEQETVVRSGCRERVERVRIWLKWFVQAHAYDVSRRIIPRGIDSSQLS
jgi:hypothetical protein